MRQYLYLNANANADADAEMPMPRFPNGLWSLFFTTSKKYFIQTPKETNHEMKRNKYTFSLVTDIDVAKSCFLVQSQNSLSTIEL